MYPPAPEHLFPRPQHRAGAAGIDVLHNGLHPRAELPHLGDKGPGPGQDRGGGHQGHQHPSGGAAVAHQHMADKPRAPVLLVGLVPAEPGGLPHRLHRLVQGGVVEQAGGHRHHPVGARGVNAAVQPPARPGAEGGDGLVAVVPGVLHPQDGGHRPELPQQRLHPGLLLAQLLRIGGLQQGAAAAALPQQGADVSLLRHGLSSVPAAPRFPHARCGGTCPPPRPF